ncbi:MAG: VOC family protein [bacterium]
MKFVHTNIVAKDVIKLTDFYCKVFECKQKGQESILAGEWVAKGTGVKDAEIRSLILELPGYDKNEAVLVGEIVTKEFKSGTLCFSYIKDPEGNIIEIQSWKSKS